MGSGFKEGPEKKGSYFNKHHLFKNLFIRSLESEEPLHLCISSKHYHVYKMACSHVEDMLSTIYQEYKAFCLKNGRKNPEVLEIRCIQSIPNSTPSKNDTNENLKRKCNLITLNTLFSLNHNLIARSRENSGLKEITNVLQPSNNQSKNLYFHSEAQTNGVKTAFENFFHEDPKEVDILDLISWKLNYPNDLL